MSTPAHTPTPWRIDPEIGNYVITDNGKGIAACPAPLSDDNAAFIVRACNSHAANEAYKQSLFTLLDALYVSPDLPMADVLAKLARLEARNAKRAQDNAGLVAALERLLTAFIEARALAIKEPMACTPLVTSIQCAGGAVAEARAALAAAKEQN